MLLQARLLCLVYHGTFDKLPSVKAKESAPTERKATPSSLHSPSQKPSAEDGRKEVGQVQLDEISAPGTHQPEVSLVTEAPVWQTKVLSSRKVGHGRSYAVKQVDVPMSSGFEMPGNESSRANKGADISVPQDSDPQASITTGSLAARRVVPTIPPGFDPQRSATGATSLVQTPASVFHDLLNPKATSFEPDDDVETLKAAGHLTSSDATTEESSVQTTESVFDDSLNPNAASFKPDDHTETSKSADKLSSSTRIAVRLPSGGSRSTTRSARHPKVEARQISSAIEHNASLCNNERLAEPADVVPRNRIARSSAIKKVQPAQHLQLEPTHPTDQAVTIPPKTCVVPATTDNVTTRVEVSPLTDSSSGACPETPLTAIVSPLDPEEAAREALKTASRERESFRKKLTTGYSQERALEFAEKARMYKEKRQDLADCMPWGELSIADEKSFPYLSTKDTTEPQVCHSTINGVAISYSVTRLTRLTRSKMPSLLRSRNQHSAPCCQVRPLPARMPFHSSLVQTRPHSLARHRWHTKFSSNSLGTWKKNVQHVTADSAMKDIQATASRS